MTPHRVAVVDDDPEVRALVRTRLRLDDRFVVVGDAGSGHEAVALVERERPDVLLLDVSMPGSGGLEALRTITDRAPHTRVVLFTGFEEDGLADAARRLGSAAFVHKSTDLDALVRVLDRVARGVSDGHPGPDHGDAVGAVADDGAPRLEPVLHEQVERFREVFDRAAIGIGTLTLTGQLVRANPALAELLAAPPEDLVGIALADLAPAAEHDIVAFTLARAVDEGVAHLEHHLAGGGRTVHTTAAAVRDSRGRPLYLVVQCQDLSAQRSTERALLESEARFGLLVESVVDYAIFLLDTEGRIATWNRGAERLKGWPADEVLGRHFRLFYEPEDRRTQHPEHELAVARRDGRYEEEGWRLRRDGSRFRAHVVITALRDADGALVGYAKVTRDVTAQHEASRALEASAAELAEANARLGEAAQQRADILAITAHELRSPLAVVAGTSRTLREHWRRLEEAERVELLRSAEQSADRMRRMLDELLLAARLDAGRLEVRGRPVDLRELLESVVTTQRELLGAPDLVLDCPAGLVVTTDPDQVVQVVTNYVSNAVRHGAGPVTVAAWPADDGATVVVEDRGPGIPPAVAEQAFHEMFLRGGSHRGTGLGLFIVRRIAAALGGESWYERSDGTTRFGLSLPAAPPPG